MPSAQPAGNNSLEPVTDVRSTDNPFVPLEPQRLDNGRSAPRAVSGRLNILHVRIPRSKRDAARLIWNHLDDDVLDSEVAYGLRQNGFRVGIGRREWWDAIKATVDGIDGHRASELESIHLRPGYPLGLELNTEEQDESIWVVERDGVLSGASWPKARNVLRVSYAMDRQRPERAFLYVVPEVRQHLPGWQWVRNESGVSQVPRRGGRTFTSAAVQVPLEPGEFLVIAPGPRSDVPGLIGGVFLTNANEDPAYDLYVFLSLDVQSVHQPG